MADTEATTINDDAAGGDAPIVAVPLKGKKAKMTAPDKAGSVAKKPKTKPNHPPTSEMVQNAIKSLKERGGSSLQAIKKYISATYKIDADKLSPFIKKYIKSAVIGGQLVQTKGKGASGSFRLPTAAKPKQPKKSVAATSKPKAVKKSTAKSPVVDKKPKAVVKKESTIRKPVIPKKPVEEKKKAAVPVKVAKKEDVKTTTKQKPTKPVKSDAAKKPKTPKPKKASAGVAKKAKK